MSKVISWIIVALVFILPLFFLPITTEFYVFNKQTLLIFVTGVLLMLWALRLVEEKTLSFRKTPLDLPILLFLLAYVIATIIASPNKVEALMGSTSVGTVLALTALYFVITNNVSVSSIRYIVYSFIASAAVLGLVAIYQFIGLGETFAPVEWMKPKLWTPAGGPLILLTFLGVNLFLTIVLFLKKLNQQTWFETVWLFVATLLIALGLITTLYQVLPGKETSLIILPYKDSWAIAIEAFKQNPLFGVGPGNYLSAFNRFRPITFNNYNFWNIRFNNASSYPFELLTMGGILTLGAWLFLVFKSTKELLQKKTSEVRVGVLVLLAIQLFLPLNFLILTTTFLFLAILSLSQAREELVSFPAKTLPSVVLGLVGLLVLISFYGWGRAYAADYHFRQSLNALVQNRGTDTYNSQIRAISLNPYRENYRVAYSQTNFALANALAGQPDLSDQDRANISLLIQQAIREAKIATVLNPTRADYWENLAQLYRNLVNFAQGADQWALAAYQQAIILDPINPRLRVNLGGLFYGTGNYEEAVRYFQNAVNLKPDFANGYYNLAAAYREQEKYLEAFNAMQVVVNLVPADSVDYQTSLNELEELRAKLPAKEATPAAAPTGPGELTPPEPLPSPAIEPPIELPEEAGPEISPTPSPSPTPTPEITP